MGHVLPQLMDVRPLNDEYKSVFVLQVLMAHLANFTKIHNPLHEVTISLNGINSSK